MSERISVGRIPGGGVREISLDQDEEMTVRDAYRRAEFNPDGCVIKKNGQDCSLDDIVLPGDTLMAYTQNIKGN